MSTTRLRLWGLSTRAFSSSGVPDLLLACRKETKKVFTGCLQVMVQFRLHGGFWASFRYRVSLICKVV